MKRMRFLAGLLLVAGLCGLPARGQDAAKKKPGPALSPSQEVLELKVKPAVVAFLKERGLELSEEKTRITPIDAGFDFLGFNVRKYAGKLLIKPSKDAIKGFLERIPEIIKTNVATKTEDLIRQLN